MTKNLNLGIILTISRSHISKLQIFLKNRFHSNWRSYLVLTSGQKPRKSIEPLLRKISKCQYQYQCQCQYQTFLRISPNQEFFSKILLSLFYLFSPLTSCNKSEKSWSHFWKNCTTNQPTNQLLSTTPIL